MDRLVVAIAKDTTKDSLFSLNERLSLVRQELESVDGKGCKIEVRSFEGLLIDFSKEIKKEFKAASCVIVRGLRVASDFEYEFQMAGMNNKLSPDFETLFLMASDCYQFISSRFVREIARLGGDVTPFVSAAVVKALKR
jgi:pantetheine-phosphate adenylyltransferase